MVNPFKHTAKVVTGVFENAQSSDCAPGPAIVGAAAVMPFVIPAAFISAFFKKGAKAK